MMDDLARIERVYGCVAEYNRCMEEEQWGYEDKRGYEPTFDEIMNDEIEKIKKVENRQFYMGEEIRDYEFDGGITDYKIIKFNKDRTKVYVTETWYNIDGCGKRRPHWCNLKMDDSLNPVEKFQPDDNYDSWIRKEI